VNGNEAEVMFLVPQRLGLSLFCYTGKQLDAHSIAMQKPSITAVVNPPTHCLGFCPKPWETMLLLLLASRLRR
jgi:hypothetical protein